MKEQEKQLLLRQIVVAVPGTEGGDVVDAGGADFGGFDGGGFGDF